MFRGTGEVSLLAPPAAVLEAKQLDAELPRDLAIRNTGEEPRRFDQQLVPLVKQQPNRRRPAMTTTIDRHSISERGVTQWFHRAAAALTRWVRFN